MSRTSIGRRLRTQALADAGGRCGYCLSSEEITGAPLEIEHLIPEARGGPTRRSNLWAACRQCNALKSDQVEAIDPETGTSEPLFNPGTSAGRSTSCGVTREIVSLGGTRHRSECPCP